MGSTKLVRDSERALRHSDNSVPLGGLTAYVLYLEKRGRCDFADRKASKKLSQGGLLKAAERGAESSACSVTVRAVRPAESSNQERDGRHEDTRKAGMDGEEGKGNERSENGIRENAPTLVLSF